MKKPLIIAVIGPTATGKTKLGIELAKRLSTEIISADSRVIYRELDIGTAKPTLEELQGIPHHMLNVAGPNEVYSSGMYQQDARPILQQLLTQNQTPIVVGGTGFYIRGLLQEQYFASVEPDETLRTYYRQLALENGPDYLYQLLARLDPKRAKALHPNDQFRIIRALEIIEKTGGPVPPVQPAESPWNVVWLGLTYADRSRLRAVIDRRIEEMLDVGWLEEVQRLLKTYGPHAHALQVAHGYPEWVRYIQGEVSFDEAKRRTQTIIHQYARRQMTWFQANPDIQWFPVDELSFEEILQAALEAIDPPPVC